jgi:hypothetical protein
MNADIGEYMVGAYLKVVLRCDVVDYNVRPPEEGLAGLSEFDVIGFDFPNKRAYLCEVATHLGGLEYGKGYEDSAERVRKKLERQKAHAEQYLGDFIVRKFMFWSPRVPQGALLNLLSAIDGLELVVNEDYAKRVKELCTKAGKTTKDNGNPVFRTLQILEHLNKRFPMVMKEA